MEQVICWCNDLHIYQHLLTLTDLLSLVGPHTLYACLFVCLPACLCEIAPVLSSTAGGPSDSSLHHIPHGAPAWVQCRVGVEGGG